MKLSENIDVLEIKSKQTYYPVLLHDAENLILVDAGFPLDFEPLSDAVSNCGFDVKDIPSYLESHKRH